MPEPARAPAPAASWSITVRLAVLFAVSAALLLALSTGFLYWVLTDNLQRADRQFLGDKVEVLRDVLQSPASEADRLREEVQTEVAAYQSTRYYARVLSPGGTVVIETPGMAEALPPAVFPDADAPAPNGSYVEWDAPSGRAYLLRAASGDAGGRRLHVALDVTPEAVLLADYRRTLALVLVLGVLAAAAAGAVAAWHGLRPLRRITGRVAGVTASDLHTRVAAERWPRELAALAAAFDAMLDRLEDAFARLSQFSADLAHELRSPVAILTGEAEVALARTREPEEYRQVLASSLEELGRLTRTIEALLFLARAEGDDAPIERTPVDARALADGVIEFYEAVAEEGGVALRADGHARLDGDPVLLRRALANLVDNALQHTPPGGRVDIHVTEGPDGAASVVVADTGPGVDPAHLPRLFDRLFRADASRARRHEGSGLGLSIVRSVMDLHGGTATAENGTDGGAAFTLLFPPASR